MKRAALIAATASATVAGAAFLGLVAVPAAYDWYEGRHEESATYATGTAAKEARTSVPRWLPDAAQEISYAMKTTGGERLMKATLPKTPANPLPATCKPLPKDQRAKDPELQAPWFPKQTTGKQATHRCEIYYAYTDGDTLYAWQHNDDWIASNKAAAGH
ncbi:hypothetical protein OG897_16255 [Streptomyces sp. NBC_00237]|uniref:hypothetical protein n=1 Tax=Streptomyces sp. NBC_00237 TaxID=2975687 RepID=UPI00225336E1|nr:hypothetical protein [Streptomyces sp. NBC_00237]MCX5202995.1 hypothetical protein [Streptomyces sp. NBC_00237]